VLSLHVLKLALIQASTRMLETVMFHAAQLDHAKTSSTWSADQLNRKGTARIAAKLCVFFVQPVLDGVLANYKHWEAASRAPGPQLKKTASAKHD